MSLPFRLLFIATASLLLWLLNRYSWRRFLLPATARWPRLNRLLAHLFWPLVAAETLFFILLPTHTLSGAGYVLPATLVGLSFMLFVMATLYDLGQLTMERAPFRPDRRRALKSLFNLTMLLVALAYFLRGLIGGQAPPRINRVHLTIAGLERPLRLVQISDLHLGPALGREFLEDVVARVNTCQPDALVITGDLVDLDADEWGDLMKPLSHVEARLGVFFVPGNHEYFYGVERIMQRLRQQGIQVLDNRSALVDGQLNLAGVMDMIGQRMDYLPPDLDQALGMCDPAHPTVLLAHQPKTLNLLKASAPVDLVLCGHTHGGQIFPFGLLVLLDQPYLRGLYRHSPRTRVFVTTGTGYWGPPLRVLAPAEIVQLDLLPARATTYTTQKDRPSIDA